MVEILNGDEIMELLENFKDIENIDIVIEKLILSGEEYGILEKIIDGTLDKKYLKIMFPLKAKTTDWDDFLTLLEIGIMDGMLEFSDIKFGRSKTRKRPK
jgi:hypothetical protein